MLFHLVLSFLIMLISSGTDPDHHHPHYRTYFYVGGEYTAVGSAEHIRSGQIYVEKLTPTRVTQTYPIVFIHGQAQTGTNWLNKPDGQAGWISYFLKQGYECYLLDQPFRGRSPWQPFNGELATYSTEHLQRYFSAPERYSLWPQAQLHTQWPGSGVMHDPIFDEYFASTVPFVNDNHIQEAAMQKAGVALLDRIGTPVILLAHSQGGIMAWLLADQRPDLVQLIVSLEPGGPPSRDIAFGNGSARAYGLTDIPIAYTPEVSSPETDFITTTIPASSPGESDCLVQADDPPPRQLAQLRKIPVVLFTSEASYHAQYDWCTVSFLRQAGVKTEHVRLADWGIHGNGHMMFLENNSDTVAALAHQKIAQWS